MEKKQAIEKLLEKSNLNEKEKKSVRKAIVSLIKAKREIQKISFGEDRVSLVNEMTAGIEDGIAYLCIAAVPSETVIGREILCLTDKKPSVIGS